MSRFNRVFGSADAKDTVVGEGSSIEEMELQDPTDGEVPEFELFDDQDFSVVSESLRKELLKAAQCDAVALGIRTPHAYLSEGFVSTEVNAITNVTVREALEELGAPDYVFLKEGVYTEVLIVTPLLPMAESVASKKSRDWRQVTIEDVPHCYLKF